MKNYPTRDAARHAAIAAALTVAETKGYQSVTLQDVADRCNRTKAWVNRFLMAEDMPTEIMRKACNVHNLRVIAQGLATGHPLALALPEEIRRKAGEALV